MKPLTLFLLALTFASQGWGQGPGLQMDRIAPKGVDNVVTPEAFGGSQSTTDNSAALQAAINYLRTNNSAALFIPPGNCYKFGTTLRVNGNGAPYGTVIFGIYQKNFSSYPGSCLQYTGTGDGILVQGATAGTFTYDFSLKNLYIGATAAATSLVHLTNVQGPIEITGVNFDGGSNAALGGLIIDNGNGAASGSGIQVNVEDDFFFGFNLSSGKAIQLIGGGPYNFKDNQIFSTFVGLYSSTSNTTVLDHNYCELMTYCFEIGNDFSNYAQYEIQANQMTVSDSVGDDTSSKRCILIKSTNNNLPFYVHGAIKNNLCRVGPTFSQGVSPYGIEFQTSSNVFYVNQTWEIADNSISGMTTSAIHGDSPSVTINYRSNESSTAYTTGSTLPVLLPQISGTASFNALGKIPPLGTATSGQNYGSDNFGWMASYCTGASPCNPNFDNWFWDITLGSGVNPISIFNLVHSGTAGTASVSIPYPVSTGAHTATSSTVSGTGLTTLGQTTVASLPSAASNPGAMILVTDSTAVASEGQTCVGGSSNKAVAVSNGSVWKCF